jgi:hypothetical protein
VIWRKFVTQLWAEKTAKNDIAASLHLPLDELEGPIWNLAGVHPPDRWRVARRNLVRSAS